MDRKVIQAAARRIIELANEMPETKRRDFVVEAATIIKLTEGEADFDLIREAAREALASNMIGGNEPSVTISRAAYDKLAALFPKVIPIR